MNAGDAFICAGVESGDDALRDWLKAGSLPRQVVLDRARDVREAGIALGTTKWQLVWRVLLPAARNGLLAAVLLGVGRGVGRGVGEGVGGGDREVSGIPAGQDGEEPDCLPADRHPEEGGQPRALLHGRENRLA